MRILFLTKPITMYVFYRLPNQVNFVEIIIKSFSLVNLKDNEINLFGKFNISLLQKGNYILNRKGIVACQRPIQTLSNKNQEFC